MPNILLVDDDKFLARTVSEILMTEGINATIASNTKNIEKLIEENMPEVIILDYQLEEEDGITIAKKLKTKEKIKDIPIVMISSSYGIEKIAKESGIEAFIPKPFDTQKLLTTIQKLAVRSKTQSS